MFNINQRNLFIFYFKFIMLLKHLNIQTKIIIQILREEKMQNKKNKLKLVIYLSVSTLLILSSINSFGISTSILDINLIQKKNQDNKVTLNHLKTEYSSVYLSGSLLKEYKLLGSTKNNLNNIILSNALGDESYPSMVRNEYLGLVAYEFNDGSETEIYLRNSDDYGQSWSDETRVIAKLNQYSIEIDSPSLCIKPLSNKAYGFFKSPLKNSAVFGYLEIPNITKLNHVMTYTFDWTGFPDPEDPSITYDFWDFDTPKIISYKNTTTPWVIFLTGSTNYSYANWDGACNNSIMISFNDLHYPEHYITLIWFSYIEHCSNISVSGDYCNSTIYGVCEIKNGSKQDLLIFKGNPYLWYLGYNLENQTISTNTNLTHPNIFVTEDKVFIVADSESNGIVLYKKDIDSSIWRYNNVTKEIIPPSSNPNYPMIYSNNNRLYCTYIESNNIYLTSSIDYGHSWSNPIQLNSVIGSVVEEYRFQNLVDECYILWTDNRDGDNDIYLALLNEPPETPVVIGPSSGVSNISYDFIFNAVDPDNHNISYIIDWGDNTTEWTDFYPSNNSVIINHTWSEKGTYIIKAKVRDYYGFHSNWSTLNIDIDKPEIEVSIKKGLRRSIRVDIENSGTCNISNLTWNITILRRGIMRRTIFKVTGNTSSLNIGSKETVFNRPFGFGFIKVKVNVTASGMDSFEKTIKGFIFLRFIRLRRFL